MTNPYMPANFVFNYCRTTPEAKERFSKRVQKCITATLDDFSARKSPWKDVEINLKAENLHFNQYRVILEKHCKLLEQAGYKVDIECIDRREGRAIICIWAV